MKEYLIGAHHIGLPTGDMDGTVAFYTRLGAEVIFEKTVEEAERPVRVVHLKMAGLIIEAYERDDPPGSPEPSTTWPLQSAI